MKELFEQLLNKCIAEKLIDDTQKEQLLSQLDKKIQEAEELSNKNFETKLDEKVQEITKEHEEKLTESKTKIKEELIENIKNDIEKSYNEKLNEEINKIDEDHGIKLQEILEKIDEDHTSKLQEILEKIDEDHTSKLQKVVEFFEDKYQLELIEKVSEYLDTYLEEVIPESNIIDQEKLMRFENIFENIRKLALVTDDYVNNEIKEAVIDAKSQLDEKDTEINKIMLEKIELKQKLNKIEASNVLKEKLENCSPKIVAFMESTFKDATKEEIEERFDEALTAFNADEDEKLKTLSEKTKTSLNPKKITEKEDKTVVMNPQQSQMATYAYLCEKMNKK